MTAMSAVGKLVSHSFAGHPLYGHSGQSGGMRLTFGKL